MPCQHQRGAPFITCCWQYWKKEFWGVKQCWLLLATIIRFFSSPFPLPLDRCSVGALGCTWKLPEQISRLLVGSFRCHSTQEKHRGQPGKPKKWEQVRRISTNYLLLSQILPFPFRKSGTIEWHLSSRRHLRVSTHQNNLLSKTGTNSFHPTACHMLLSKLHELFRQHVGTFWLTMSRAIFFIALCHWCL